MADLLCDKFNLHTYTPVDTLKFDVESRIYCRNTVIFRKAEFIKLKTELKWRKFAYNMQHFFMIHIVKIH